MKKSFVIVSLMLFSVCAAAQVQSLGKPAYLDPQSPIEERVSDALSRMTLHEKIQVLHAQSKFTSAGVPRLGIRQLNMDDGPHGVREELEWNTWSVARWSNDSCVAFPSLTCLAATWNRDLASVYGNALSEEFAYRGKDMILGPGANIARTPMNGRAFEYMGEDPLLAGVMVVPYILAAQRNGVACCMKHFVLNDQETDRFGVNVNVSERALREIYLAPFERAVKEAHVWSIMGSYNYYNNVHCCHNDELLNGILKQEWQWDGAVVSDWGGTTDTWQAVTGGLDIEMGTYTDGKVREAAFGYNDYFLADKFEALVKEGKVPVAVLDDKVRRVLRTIYRTAMNPGKVIGSMCSEAHYDACREIGEEGIVLLKNGRTAKASRMSGGEAVPVGAMLPLRLSDYKIILIVGENATRSLTKGGGSSELKTLRDIAPLEALEREMAGSRQAGSRWSYAPGYVSGRPLYDHVDKTDPAESDRLKAEAVEKAREADLIIFIGGLNKNHRQDCENGDRESYDLPFGQNELIGALIDSKPAACRLVVVTFGGNPFATPWLDRVDAFLHCWYLGSEAGSALANVLTGRVCPSGRLPVTFAKRYEDYPYVRYGERAYPGLKGVEVEANSAGERPRSQVYYDEGIFMGYRGFEKNNTQPLFPFGFGLSYTTFTMGGLQVERVAPLPSEAMEAGSNSPAISVLCTVTNTGGVAGKEVVQVYVAAPRSKQMEKPAKELKAFAKTRLLQPGESETVRMTISRRDLASWDEGTHQWRADKGKYTILVGENSRDIVVRGSIDL